jgi:hypothetical protein
MAGGTRRITGQPQRHCHTIKRIIERQSQITLEILTTPRLPGTPAAATAIEQSAEELTEAP